MFTEREVEDPSVDRLEREFLSWLTVASIFLAGGLILITLRKLYAVIFLIITIVLLMIILIHYIRARTSLILSGKQIFPRLDQLYLIIGGTVAILILISLDILTGDFSDNSPIL